MGNFSAAFAAQIALKQRLKHQHQGKTAVAFGQLPANVAPDTGFLDKRNTQSRSP
jgi:hypothetical protein